MKWRISADKSNERYINTQKNGIIRRRAMLCASEMPRAQLRQKS
jgi:hypothetical protein